MYIIPLFCKILIPSGSKRNKMKLRKAPAQYITLVQAAEMLAGEPQWVRDGSRSEGRMSENFMKAYGFLLSALASGELKARGPDNPDAEEMIVNRELCWDWVIERRHLSAFLERQRTCTPAPGRALPQFETARDSLLAAPIPPRRS
jgi:hypothetical protein